MTREIKFRAWLRNIELMVYDNGSDSGYGGTGIKYIDTYEKIIFTQHACYSYDFEEVDPVKCTCALMQFTGLHDGTKWEELSEDERSTWTRHSMPSKWKGKEIYDGDVLSFAGYMTADNSMGQEPNGYIYDDTSIHQVIWDNTIGAWGLKFTKEEEAAPKYRKDTRWLMIDGSCEVIGNVYEHPKLISSGGKTAE